jgi:chromate transporter
MIYLQLFWEFMKIGIFAIGGGMATLPFLQRLADSTGWFSQSLITDMIAISESTPGPIGINMATYVGYASAGIPGGILAPLGLVTPAFCIILLVAKILSALWQSPKIQGLFYALRPASVGLIAAAAFSVCAVSLFTWDGTLTLHWSSIALFAVLMVAMQLPKLKKLPSVTFIGIAAAVGIIFKM